MQPYQMCKTPFQVEINKISKKINQDWNIFVESDKNVSFLYKGILSFSWSVENNFPETPVNIKWNYGAAKASIISKITQFRAFQPIYWNMCTSLTKYILHLDNFLAKQSFEELEQIEITKKEKLILDLFDASRTFTSFDNDTSLPEFGIDSKSINSGVGYSNNQSSNQQIEQNCTYNTIQVLNKLWNYVDKVQQYHHLIKNIVDQMIKEMSSIDYDLYSEESSLSNWLKKFNLEVETVNESDQVKLIEEFKHHHFFNQRNNTNPKFAKRILSEIKALKQSLPDKMIYITWSENQMNLLKALIFPADDTPYSRGYFQFDILLPNDYPNVPPKVQFMTTGGGTIRFNPNYCPN